MCFSEFCKIQAQTVKTRHCIRSVTRTEATRCFEMFIALAPRPSTTESPLLSRFQQRMLKMGARDRNMFLSLAVKMAKASNR